MIKLTVPRNTSVLKPTNVKSAGIFKGLIDRALAPLSAAGVKLNAANVRRAQEELDSIEQKLTDSARLAIQLTVKELKDATPVATGATRAGWTSSEKVMPTGVLFTVEHPDHAMINRLNYGTKPHIIRPRNTKALRFVVGGKVIFAKLVNHPGTAGSGFIERAKNTLDLRIQALKSFKG